MSPLLSNADLKETMGRWLSGLVPWEFFSTWTFSKPVRLQGAMYWARRHTRILEARAHSPLYGFVTAEQGNVGGLLHLHALLGNCGVLKAWCGAYLKPGDYGRSCCMVHSWPCGIARVLPYDPKRGASFYIAKYVTKTLAEWELFGFPAQPQSSFKTAVNLSYSEPLPFSATASRLKTSRRREAHPTIRTALGQPLSNRLVSLLSQ